MTDFAAYTPVGEIRPSAILVNSETVVKDFGVQETGLRRGATPQEVNIESTEIILGIDLTKGALTSCSIKIYFSTDGTNWFQEASESTAAGVSSIYPRSHIMVADAKVSVAIAITHPFIRVSTISVGDPTGSLLAIDAHFVRKLS